MKYRSDAVEVVASARAFALVGRKGVDDARDLEVEAAPELDQLAPGSVGVATRADPVVLVVRGEDQVVLEPRANKPLVVVRGGVDQVADQLARRPLAGRGLDGASLLVDCAKSLRGLFDDRA